MTKRKIKKAPTKPKKAPHGGNVLESSPMYVMWALGAILFYQLGGWPYSLTYLVYCVLSIVWFVRFICPYCGNSRMGRCSSGMGQLASRLFEPKPPRLFKRQFKYNVICQFPVWFLPPIAGGYLLYMEYSNLNLVVLIIFLVVAFGIYPFASSSKTCEDCTMWKVCPFKRGRKK
jgi:hypothetical protein